MKRSRSAETVGGITAEQSAEISLVPLVDLCLTLVVVFLMLTPMSITSLLPITSSNASGGGESAAPEKETPLLVNLGADQVTVGAITLDSDLQIAAWFRDAFGSRRNHELLLETSPNVSQDRLVRWLDTVRTSGEWTVTLVIPQEAHT